ncbi:hypothetical protein B0T20DRAFT_372449 [Sordaria brevicollis]|uniref:Kelch repeat protein n=1 Tax=Sordaria brevicollis TaxID=83679 RepID=A0AAE0PGH2_SORBR|nr:hypothetical protein B0T20DRAFT_372449 [Sordaria brevicollis]
MLPLIPNAGRVSLHTFYLATSFISALLPVLVHAQYPDAPDPSNFVRRAHSRAIVLGDFLYIDGGELSQFVDGVFMPDDQPTHGINSTLSIDLSKSWTASTVQIKQIPLQGPIMMNSVAIWPDTTGNGYYLYGGVTSYNQNNTGFPKEGIWKFVADGRGGGTWSLEEAANLDTFSSLRYTTNSAYASTGGIGFAIGGYQSRFTDPSITARSNLRWQTAGMVSYDMGTREWKNDSQLAEGFLEPNQSLEDGRAIHVPGFGTGPNGLIFALGGAAKTAGVMSPGITHTPLVSFSVISFFDPDTKKWYAQATTGEAPKGRLAHCVVGAQSPEGSFEIFVFGGTSVTYDTAFGDLYVLSVPGFHWFRAEDRSGDIPRASGTCVVIGKRQMLTIGGVDYGKGNIKYWKDQDPLPQGLGIFDMTDLRWVRNGSYDADAEAYRAPQVVQDWYRAQNAANQTVQWSSDEVKALFSSADVTFSTDEPAPPVEPPKKNGNNNNTGLIAGCVMGGCVVFLAICVAVTLYRNRRFRQKTEPCSSSNQQGHYKSSTQPVEEKPKELEWSPLESYASPVEAYQPPAELAGGINCWELPEAEQYSTYEKERARAELDG